MMSGIDKFLSEATSLYWWISVVVVGVLLNLLSSYMKQPIDRLAALAFERYKARKQRLSSAFETQAEMLLNDRDEREWAVQEEHRLYFRCLRRTLLGVWIMGGSMVLVFVTSKTGEAAWIRYFGNAGVFGGLMLWLDAGSVYQQAFSVSALLRRARELGVAEREMQKSQAVGSPDA